jgi:glycosyltransferase involved in cell wall biosynthesis
MRILYICDALAIYGGLERVLVDKANWLVEKGGYEVSLLTINQGSHPICFPLHPDVVYNDLNIRFHQYSYLPFWKRFFKRRQLYHVFRKRLAKKIQEEVPDIIICTRLDYVRDIVQVKGVIPLVFETHSSCLVSRFEGEGLLHRFYTWYLQLAVRKAQMVVALTNGDADQWRKLTSKVCVIPNVVHLNETGRNSDCHSKSVIFVGRYTCQKDIQSLLRIWSLVIQRHQDWQLHIFGGYGNEKEKLQSQMRGMDMNIVVHESTSTIYEEYLRSSLLLMTSRYEPFGLVLPEAMSCGLPVVAFDCPYGPADIISDGMDGFLIRNRSTEDYVDKVCLLMEDEELRRKMGQKGVHSAQRYNANQVMPQWKKLFEQIIRTTIK